MRECQLPTLTTSRQLVLVLLLVLVLVLVLSSFLLSPLHPVLPLPPLILSRSTQSHHQATYM
jgi:hypothetical protein